MTNNQNFIVLCFLFTILLSSFTLLGSARRSSNEFEIEKAKTLAHDAIAQGIREVKEIKMFINSLLKLKSLRYLQATSNSQVFGCVEGVMENMDELKDTLYLVKHLKSSDNFLFDDYSQPMEHVLKKTKKNGKMCVNALKDVEDLVFATMVKRKLKDLSLIVDDVVYRLHEIKAARKA